MSKVEMIVNQLIEEDRFSLKKLQDVFSGKKDDGRTIYSIWDKYIKDKKDVGKAGTASLENTELLEHFAHLLAKKAQITTANTKLIKISKECDLLLSERFDRTKDGRRIHFASAMSLLGLDDGCGADTGNGYLDIVDSIMDRIVKSSYRFNLSGDSMRK